MPRTVFELQKKKGYASILDIWNGDDVYRASQLSIGWTEEPVKHMDVLGIEDHTYHATKEEGQMYRAICGLLEHKSLHTS